MSSLSHLFYDAVFFSPHLDDAILSAGGLIRQSYLDKKRVLIVTLFTQGDDTIFSESAIEFLKQSQNTPKSSTLFKKRRQEDLNAVKKIGANHFHFQFVDALFRKDEHNQLTYPDFSYSFSGKVSSKDRSLSKLITQNIQEKIMPYIGSKTKTYGPLAIGNHVDHVITFEILRNLFKKNIYWQDVPYDAEYLPVIQRLTQLKQKNFLLNKQILDITKIAIDKQKSIECYDTQLVGLKSAGLQPKHFFQEIYYSLVQ